ncbi:MAG: hypothetical protein WKF73_11575 [Nocardioidaceae bacterium]
MIPLLIVLVLACWVGTLLWLVPLPISAFVTALAGAAWLLTRERDKRRTA